MKRYMRLLLILSASLLFSCAGRNPELISKTTDQDGKMDCAMLLTEINKCESCIIDKYHSGKNAMENTVGSAVVGYILFPPLFFFMDLKQADYKEMGSYQERRNYLIELGKSKNCDWCDKEETDDDLLALADKEHQIRKKKEMKEREQQEKEDPFR